MSFIYKYATYTLTPFLKPHAVLNLAEQNVFYVQLYMESAFTYNPGLTIIITLFSNAHYWEQMFLVKCLWNVFLTILSAINS